jgi:hypothetical protein
MMFLKYHFAAEYYYNLHPQGEKIATRKRQVFFTFSLEEVFFPKLLSYY